MPMNIKEAINFLETQISDASAGLPQDLFYFTSRVVPMVNVDLLIKNEKGSTLLSWRDDPYAGKGWHIPGGIVRFKEKLETRIEKVAESEIGISIEYEPDPISVNQVICEQNTRGHFISLLYKCSISSTFKPENKNIGRYDPGYLKWFKKCPDNLVKVHEMYRQYI